MSETPIGCYVIGSCARVHLCEVHATGIGLKRAARSPWDSSVCYACEQLLPDGEDYLNDAGEVKYRLRPDPYVEITDPTLDETGRFPL